MCGGGVPGRSGAVRDAPFRVGSPSVAVRGKGSGFRSSVASVVKGIQSGVEPLEANRMRILETGTCFSG